MFQGITGAETNKTVKFYPMRVGNAMILQGIDCDGKTIYGYPYRDGNICKAETVYKTCGTSYIPDCCEGVMPCNLVVELSGFSGSGLVYPGEYRETAWDLSVINGTYSLYEDGCDEWRNYGSNHLSCSGSSTWVGSCGTHVGIEPECTPGGSSYGATFIVLTIGAALSTLSLLHGIKINVINTVISMYDAQGTRSVSGTCDVDGMLGAYSMPAMPPGAYCEGSGGTGTVSVPS
jgi:hypothetical protein